MEALGAFGSSFAAETPTKASTASIPHKADFMMASPR
jgi:hypothetical protein